MHGSPGLAALILVGPCATVVYNTAVARRSSEAMLSNIVNIVSVCTAFAIYAYRSRTCIALSHEVINLLTVYICSYARAQPSTHDLSTGRAAALCSIESGWSNSDDFIFSNPSI